MNIEIVEKPVRSRLHGQVGDLTRWNCERWGARRTAISCGNSSARCGSRCTATW